MTDLQILAAIVFLLAYYYFVLRKYNTLGFRLFSLCFFVSVAFTYWWWVDWRELKRVEHTGIATMATVLQKTSASEHRVTVAFKTQTGDTLTRVCEGGISDEELAALTLQQATPIIYSPESDTFFLEKSYQRQQKDLSWVLLFPAFFLTLGSICWLTLRRYRIYPHEGTAYEYMVDETGKVVLDDAKSEASKALKKWSLLSKLTQILQR